MAIDLDISDSVLKPILAIRGLSATDREHIEHLIREADRAAEGFDAGEPTGIRADLFVDRIQYLLRQAQVVIAKYAD